MANLIERREEKMRTFYIIAIMLAIANLVLVYSLHGIGAVLFTFSSTCAGFSIGAYIIYNRYVYQPTND